MRGPAPTRQAPPRTWHTVPEESPVRDQYAVSAECLDQCRDVRLHDRALGRIPFGESAHNLIGRFVRAKALPDFRPQAVELETIASFTVDEHRTALRRLRDDHRVWRKVRPGHAA